jgi:DNA-binding MurR/RpiR family transcriptional regulator
LANQKLDQIESGKRVNPGNPPPAFDDIISRLHELRPKMKPAEQRVADVVLSDVEGAVRSSNTALAAKANVSEPTVTRFCRTMKCEGVRDFKLRLAQSLVVGTMYLNFRDPPPERQATGLPFWNDVFQKADEAVRLAEHQLDKATVITSIEHLVKAKRIYIFGVGGGSTALAQDAQFRLFRYGLAVTAYTDTYLMRMVASTLGPDDVVIAISGTGRTSEIIDAAKIAQQYHSVVVAITQPDTELAAVADLALTVQVQETPDILTPTASRFAFMVTLDLLAAGVGYQLGLSAQENLRRIKYTLMNRRDGEISEPLGD